MSEQKRSMLYVTDQGFMDNLQDFLLLIEPHVGLEHDKPFAFNLNEVVRSIESDERINPRLLRGIFLHSLRIPLGQDYTGEQPTYNVPDLDERSTDLYSGGFRVIELGVEHGLPVLVKSGAPPSALEFARTLGAKEVFERPSNERRYREIATAIRKILSRNAQ